MNDDFPLTPNEVRQIREQRAIAETRTRATAASNLANDGVPPNATISAQEWELICLHRVAKQAKLTGGGIVSNLQDPMAQMNAVAVVVLWSLRGEVITGQQGDPLHEEVVGYIDRWLGILGADGNETQAPQEGQPSEAGPR